MFSVPGQDPRVGVRLQDGAGDVVVDVSPLAAREGLRWAATLAEPSLNAFMAEGPGVWAEHRRWLLRLLGAEGPVAREVRAA